MKKLPIGMQNFEEIIMGDYVYVDKTEYIYNLLDGAKYYFLSRPRRFGKSLLLDTIGEVFKGNKELFDGLWIYGSDYAFECHPVIRLDMSNIPNDTADILKASLFEELAVRMQREEINISGTEPAILFKRLIENLHEKYNQRVVVLIDEYDKPILDHIDDLETAEANRKVLRGFYGILKSMDPNLRFIFITGVSKFTKTSIFSELNNLTDITLTEKYANICGIAIEDLRVYFIGHIRSLTTQKRYKGFDSLFNKILAWYDGYSWDGENRVINPFSLFSFFSQERFGAFWYASGSPKFLIDLIKKNLIEYTNLKNMNMTEFMLDAADFSKLEAIPLLFQTGYLTIKGIAYVNDAPVYTLDVPNYEVRDAFNKNIIAAFTDSGLSGAENARLEMTKALQAGDLQKILNTLRGLFASIPYQLHVDSEAYYHSIFYAIMAVLGFDIDTEVLVARGRVDAVLELADKVYVMEFKYEHCPPDATPETKQRLFEKALQEGMEQIKDRGYHKKYSGSGKNIYQAAFAFLGRDDIEMSMISSFEEISPPPIENDTPPPVETPATANVPEADGTVEFGGYEWMVLDVQGDKVLLLSRDIIELRAYHNTGEDVTWETSDIRKYLNGEFYNRFSTGERARIAETRVINNDNQWYGTSGGNDTNDKVFLLSLEELVRYFGDSGKLWEAKPDEYWFDDEYYNNRLARISESFDGWSELGFSSEEWDEIMEHGSWSWWLRSPGINSYDAADVQHDGDVYVIGCGVYDNCGGVRPALWLNRK